MDLQRLFGNIPGTLFFGGRGVDVTGLEYDSRRVRAGQLFFAITGMKQDGARYIPEAIARGAGAIAAELPPGELSTSSQPAWVQVPNIRAAMAVAADCFYDHPSGKLKLMGVTGTNGKTTVAYLVASILRTAAWKPGLFGTIEYDIQYLDSDGGAPLPAPNTTPESLDLQRMLNDVVQRGGRSAVMEVSSHALELNRVAACHFHAAIFTNFSRDHLDFHQDLESYFAAKRKLFIGSELNQPPDFAILNRDDPRFSELREVVVNKVITFGLGPDADVHAPRWKASRHGLELTAKTPTGPVEIRSPLIGRHNVYNILAAVAATQTLEISAAKIAQGIQAVQVRGRMESVDEGQPFGVFVDYAHTDEALRNLLSSAREWTTDGRIILVFGCGGDRDRSKRPLMGMVAGEADKAVLTSDNPRTEDALGILNDVIVGLQKARANYDVEPDRAKAIALALREAKPGDTVLIAGKGHETYQWIGDKKLSFDDREVARGILKQMGFEKKKAEA